MKMFEPVQLIKKIKEGDELDKILSYAKNRLFVEGPVETGVLETFSYFKLLQPNFFAEHEEEVLSIMGVYFKNPTPTSVASLVFDLYSESINEELGQFYTPVQASIVQQIEGKKSFSFSAPTSTGKSFVFQHIIKDLKHDVAIIVPSRALINEYFDRINELFEEQKNINILTFVDKINTDHAQRNIFILTPERAREIFKFKNDFNIELFLFDEAQLGDDDSIRGIHFDSVVRRVIKGFPNSRFVFAHPFVDNPQAQLEKNKIDVGIDETAAFSQYKQKNVGQIYYQHDDNWNYYFQGIDKSLMGTRGVQAIVDPIETAIKSGGSVLIFTAKARIIRRQPFTDFAKYIAMCPPISPTTPEGKDALEIIEKIKRFLGAATETTQPYYSEMLNSLERGIVVHHGSLPLNCRLELERFTQKGYCRICFATSTLEQGVNMPFDVVYLDRISSKRTLALKNLIGRAGRSTKFKKFDFGSVVVAKGRISEVRKTLDTPELLDNISHLDKEETDVDDKYQELKDAINNNEFSDEYNLTNSDLAILETDEVEIVVKDVLDLLFDDDGKLIKLKNDESDTKIKRLIYGKFDCIYESYLKRSMVAAEKAVLNTAVKIMLWKAYQRKFSDICQFRYNYVTNIRKRRENEKKGEDVNIGIQYLQGYVDLPNKKLKMYPLFKKDIKPEEIDYDIIVCDTYDFLDKLIGFKLSDIFYAAFKTYADRHPEETNATEFSKFIRYGTSKDREIMLQRYGFTFDDIEWLDDSVESISDKQIVFNSNIYNFTEEQYKVIERYIYDDNVIKNI